MRRLLPLFFILFGFSAAARNAACEPVDSLLSSRNVASEPVDSLRPAAPRLVYERADPMPTVDGMDVLGFGKWVVGQLRFDDLAFAGNRMMEMVVTMIVEPDGTLSEITIINCPDERVKTQIERAVALSPRWTPGQAEGDPVRVRCMFPLNLHFYKKTFTADHQPDTMPVFDCDGTGSFPEWLWSRIPSELTPDSLLTVVRVACTVERDGSLSEMLVRVSDGEETPLSDAVVAALGDLPRCAPALSDGEPVRMQVLLKAIRGEISPQQTQGVCVLVQEMPRFEGGDLTTFYNWVRSHVNYPTECQQAGVGGRVIVEFLVEADGTVTYTSTLRSPHRLLEEEVIRILGMSPKWTPAMLDGEGMPVKFTLPVDFSSW